MTAPINWRLVRRERFAVRQAGEYEVGYVIRHMSALCALEAFASRPDDDRERMARDFCVMLPHLKIFALGLEVLDYPVRFEPMALISAGPVGVGVGTMLWIATGEWPVIALPTHRWFFRVFRPRVLGKYRRVEFMGGVDPVSRRWCRSVGFTEEGTAYKYGKRGEDFVYFAWLNPDWRNDDHGEASRDVPAHAAAEPVHAGALSGEPAGQRQARASGDDHRRQ